MSRVIFIIIGFLLLSLISLFLIWPKYQKLVEINNHIQAKETELRYLKEHFAKLKEIDKKMQKEYQVQLAKIDSALPSDASLTMLSVINLIQNEASKNGLVFKDLKSFAIILPKNETKPTTPTEKTQPILNITEIKINFEVSGFYPDFKNFLNFLEKSSKLIDVENINFSFKEDEIFLFSLGVKTYSY